MKFLITGGCGFLASNIASTLIKEHNICLLDNLSRSGSDKNLQWLRTLGSIEFVQEDIRNQKAVEQLIKAFAPDVIFHLAGQVAMTTSLANPRHDFETNVLGSINVLEAVRLYSPSTTIIYSSSNKVYGDLEDLRVQENKLRYTLPDFPKGLDESARLSFETPYGCSKGAADQYMLDYARIFGLNTVVFRHSTIYGGRQYATFDQGWVGWFCQKAIELCTNSTTPPFTISGDGKQVRDLLFVDDAVACYMSAVKHIGVARGQAFNIGGGIENSCSLLELFEILEHQLSIKLNYRPIAWRQGDQKFFVADISKANRLLNWRPLVDKQQGVKFTLDWVKQLQK